MRGQGHVGEFGNDHCKLALWKSRFLKDVLTSDF